MTLRPGKWTLLASMFVVLVLADQATKFLAVDRLTNAFQQRGEAAPFAEKLGVFYGQQHLELQATHRHVVFPSWWAMHYVENPGAAWGLFQSMSPGIRNAFFIAISLAAVAFILFYFRRLEPGQRYPQVALSLLLSGAVGNFIDRLARQYVIDFIDWYAGSYHWPTFNLADSMIVVGVLMLVLQPGQKKAAKGAHEEGREAARGGT